MEEQALKGLEEIRRDIDWAQLHIPNGRVGDFGCASGFTTLSLMSILKAHEVIGIDRDREIINRTRNQLENISDKDRVFRELGIRGFPDFRVGDVITGENLPINLDLAYCRRLLTNIWYEVGGDTEIPQLAIKNIVTTIKPGGYFLAVEDRCLVEFFDRLGLKVKAESFPFGPLLYFRHLYQKPE